MKKTIATLLIPCFTTTPSLKISHERSCLENITQYEATNNIEIVNRKLLFQNDYKKVLEEYELKKLQEEKQRQEEEEQKRIEEEQKRIEEERVRVAELNRKYNVGYNYYNLLEPSGITHGEMYSLLYGTGMEDVAWTIVQCEIDFGVNAIILASLIAEESAWGNSSRAIYQNNLSGFAVYNDYSQGAYFDTRDDSVVATARLLKYDYLSTDGSYYNGLSLGDVNISYSENTNWSSNINTIAYQLTQKYQKMAL